MTTQAMDQAQVDSIMGDLKIIDADSHFAEPAELWTSRAPAAYRDRVPQIRDVDGQVAWVLDGQFWTGLGGHTIAKGQTKTLGTLCLPYDEIDDSAWGVKGRLELMDKQGVYTAVLYPNSIGFASNAIFGIEDLDFRNIVSSIYNDSLVDVQNESGRRLLPQAVLPVWDMDSHRAGDDATDRRRHHRLHRSPTSRRWSACPTLITSTSRRCGASPTNQAR